MGNCAHPPPPPQNRGRISPVLCQKKEVLGPGQDPAALPARGWCVVLLRSPSRTGGGGEGRRKMPLNSAFGLTRTALPGKQHGSGRVCGEGGDRGSPKRWGDPRGSPTSGAAPPRGVWGSQKVCGGVRVASAFGPLLPPFHPDCPSASPRRAQIRSLSPAGSGPSARWGPAHCECLP